MQPHLCNSCSLEAFNFEWISLNLYLEVAQSTVVVREDTFRFSQVVDVGFTFYPNPKKMQLWLL